MCSFAHSIKQNLELMFFGLIMRKSVDSISPFLFSLDPSPVIGYSCHSLTPSLTNSCLENLMPVNDANCQLLDDVVTAVIWLSTLEKSCVSYLQTTDGKGRQILTSWQKYYVSKAGMETKSLTF